MEAAEKLLLERYSRLALTPGVGFKGVSRIRRLRVAVVGCGATGSHAVEFLARLGVAYVRVIDGDYLSHSNLYRMSLVTEEDADRALPKAVACAEGARRVNRLVEVEPVVERLTPGNADELLDGVDLVIDGTDNFTARLAVNEAAVAKGIPWVYVGVEGWYANVMLVDPSRGPCLACLIERPPARERANVCDIIGVFPTTVALAASVAVGVALRHVLGLGDYSGILYAIDAASARIDAVRVARRPNCPVCSLRRRPLAESYRRPERLTATPICGTEAVEVQPPRSLDIDPAEAARRLAGSVEAVNPYLVKARVEGLTVVLFRNGRAIVEGTTDTGRALEAYNRLLQAIGIATA